MEWQFIVALVVIIPIILFPAMFVWYLNLGGLYSFIKDRVRRKRWAENATQKTEKVEHGFK